MSKQQLATILEMSAQNPIPANATPAVMRAWAEDVTSHLPVAENVQIERVNCGPCDGDLILPAGGDASRMKAAGVAADLKIFDGMCHDWQLYGPMLDEGMASIEEYAAFIKAHQA